MNPTIKYLLIELLLNALNDEYGIPDSAYIILCNLIDIINPNQSMPDELQVIFNHVKIHDNRAYLPEDFVYPFSRKLS